MLHNIEKASSNDAYEIAKVINESNYHAYKDIIPKEFFKYPVVDRQKIIDDMRIMDFYVYKIAGEIVGVAALKPDPENGIGIVRWVYIHPKYQRRGIGTALMKYIEETAIRLHLKKLRLLTHEKAYWAINFYRKLGFKVTEYIDRRGWRDVIMEKTL